MTKKLSRRAAIDIVKNRIAADVVKSLSTLGMNAERCIDDTRVVKIPARIRYEQDNCFVTETIELEVHIKEVQG